MNGTSQFLVNHGLLLVFVVVLLEQLGLPLPSVPFLLAAGALAVTGKFNLLIGVGVTVLACLIADSLWFYLGRFQGTRVLGWLCRISLEPDSCVRRTQNMFTRYGLRSVTVAKFVPGLSTIAPPLAGMSGIHFGRFLAFDGLGSFLYVASFLFLGYGFSNQIAQIGMAMGNIGGRALALLIGLVTLYIAYKYWQRQRVLRELQSARITVDELCQKLKAGENPVILDLRSRAELELDPLVIDGALHLEVDDLDLRRNEIPLDRDIVVYCSCPNEVTSARVALSLQRKGFARVRPLLGGIDAWRKNNYPTANWTAANHL
jgi:membrane protein DedA with SNARE-associated domain/rhodanese-related sulfurtransferase